MTFRNPLFLLALVPIAVAGVIVLRRGLRMRPGARWPELATAPRPSAAVVARKLLPFVRLLALSLLVVALARPQVVQREQEIKTEGIDIMLALDISGSMQAEDFKPNNRLYVAKEVISDFLGLVRNDRVGLVVFAGQAFTQCPLTLDYEVLRSLLAPLDVGLIEDGTAIGTALANAVGRLKDSAAKSKVIILLTDGENNSGQIDPDTAAKIAQAFAIRVYTIGVGKEGGAPIPVQHPVYGKVYARNPDGSLVLTKLDEASLRRIAAATKGRFFRALEADALKKIYAEILDLERTKFEVKEYERAREYFRWAAFPAFGLLLFELCLGRTRLRVLP